MGKLRVCPYVFNFCQVSTALMGGSMQFLEANLWLASGSRKKCGGKLLDMKVAWGGGLRLNKRFVCFKTNVISHFKQRSVFLKQAGIRP